MLLNEAQRNRHLAKSADGDLPARPQESGAALGGTSGAGATEEPDSASSSSEDDCPSYVNSLIAQYAPPQQKQGQQ
eukprot:2844600-Lingulodinium_polyedra.AAC.1